MSEIHIHSCFDDRNKTRKSIQIPGARSDPLKRRAEACAPRAKLLALLKVVNLISISEVPLKKDTVTNQSRDLSFCLRNFRNDRIIIWIR